jgi:hypothetical protein
MVANPPGGTYSVSNTIDYISKGHRSVVFISVYFLLASGVGLLLLLGRLREAIGSGSRAWTFNALAISAVATWVAGYAMVVGVPAAYAFGGSNKLVLTHGVVYTFAEVGWAVMYGAGGTLLGCALITFAAGPVAAPAWVRWTTLVAGIAGLAALAWFPFFLVYLWAVVLGIWLLVSPASARAPEPAPAV